AEEAHHDVAPGDGIEVVAWVAGGGRDEPGGGVAGCQTGARHARGRYHISAGLRGSARIRANDPMPSGDLRQGRRFTTEPQRTQRRGWWPTCSAKDAMPSGK